MPYLPIRYTVLLGLAAFATIAGGDANADGEEVAPFVIGFERFSRHQDIAEPASAAILISELSCTACHDSKLEWLAPKKGPRLGGAGNRLNSKWLRRFILQPHASDPGSTMPDLMHGMTPKQRQESASAIAAFLQSQREPFRELKAGGALPVVHEFWRKGDVVRGGELFHKVGCVACHEPDPEYETVKTPPSAVDALLEQLDPEEIEEMGLVRAARRVDSIPHGDLAAKYSLRALTELLLDPAMNRPDARMPSLRLQPSEAADIAAFLLRDGSPESDIKPKTEHAALIAAGRQLFQQLRCANCHETQVSIEPTPATPFDSLKWRGSSNCFHDPSAAMPKYQLDQTQVDAISLLKTPDWNWGDFTAARRVEQRMLQLNCFACHARERTDDRELLGGIGRFRKPYFETTGHVDLGDEGRLPPSLAGVGRKLLPKSLASVFQPKTLPRRPYMTIRMPSYHNDAVKQVLKFLPEADEIETDTAAQKILDRPELTLDNVIDDGDQERSPDTQRGMSRLAAVGRQLVNTGCVECHPFRGESLPGVVGIDLQAMDQHVHAKWFLEFIRNPGAIKPRTRMPTFFPNGKSHRPDVLDGDVEKQIAAIWSYLRNATPAPQKIVDAMAKDFELAPADKPIVLRTFMREAGNHAIAVGLPSGWNYAFDADKVRLSIGWRGKFIDARGTWFERFAPPADPLEDMTIRFPIGPPFFVSSRGRKTEPIASAYRFDGYTLDDDLTPSFLYRFGRWRVEDRLKPNGDSLRRTLLITDSREDDARSLQTAKTSTLWFVAHAGKQLVPTKRGSMVDEQGLRVTIDLANLQEGTVVQRGESKTWQIPLSRNLDTEPVRHQIRVNYQW